MKVVTVKLTDDQYNNMTLLDLMYMSLKANHIANATVRRPDNLKLPDFVNGGK